MPLAQPNLLFKPLSLNCKGRLLSLEEPVVMGILNYTPDSFYEGSRNSTIAQLINRAGEMLAEGAAILDIGGYSTRPGAADVPEKIETERVVQSTDAILNRFPEAIISVDTFRASVAAKAIAAGAHIVNDVSGGALDPEMFDAVASLQVPYILMHMRGTPQTMQQLTHYQELIPELISYFEEKIYTLRQKNITNVVLDPGFGFAKTTAQNFELLSQLHQFRFLGLPILIGISRKSMVYKALGNTPADALTGTTALHMAALHRGATILRAHDVKEATQTIQLYQRMSNFRGAEIFN